MRILLLAVTLLTGCANQTFYTKGKNAKGGDVAIKTFTNSGDMVGNVEMSPGHVSVRLPDGPIPYADVVVMDGKGRTFSSRQPVMPGIYNSTVNNGNWAGAAKLVNEVGSAIFKSTAVGAGANVLGAGIGAIPK
jgi:hypothetical protein